MEIYRDMKSSHDFRFSDDRPNPVSSIAIYFPGFGQNPEQLKTYCDEFQYIETRVERSCYVSSFRVDNGEPRRFLSFQGIGCNVELIMRQIEGFIAENGSLLQSVVLVGHSMGALYASFCLLRLLKKYPHLEFELHEYARPPFVLRPFLHSSFLKHGGLVASFHALYLMLMCFLTLGLVRKYRGYRTPAFAIQGLYINDLGDDNFVKEIARGIVPDATLAYFSAALVYGVFSKFRKSEVQKARDNGWNGKHVVYATGGDRVFRFPDQWNYAWQHQAQFRSMYAGKRIEQILGGVKALPPHCPFY